MTMIKSGLGIAGLVAVTALTFGGAAKAEDREFAYSANIGFYSDYIFRGISLTANDPTIQGSVDLSYGQLYLGVWGSGVGESGTDDGYAPVEVDIYAGWKPVVGRVTFDFGAIGYTYPFAGDALDYIEFKAAASTEIVKGLTGGVTTYYTPDQNNYNETYTVEGSLAYALPQYWVFTPTVSGLVGYSEDTSAEFGETTAFSDIDTSYTYWNVGLTLAVEKLSFDFRYWDTNLDVADGGFNDGLADSRFLFSAKITLP